GLRGEDEGGLLAALHSRTERAGAHAHCLRGSVHPRLLRGRHQHPGGVGRLPTLKENATVPPATHNHEALTVEVVEEPTEVRVTFRGRSAAREPGQFLIPILKDSLQRAAEQQRPLVLDFSAIDYMNSSTFAPLVKLLDDAARGG